MKRLLLAALAALLLISVTGCSPVITRGAIPLGDTGANGKEIWVYMDTSHVKMNGVYRCRDAAGDVVCIKAAVVNKK